MAVLIEAISVIIRRRALERKLLGGLARFDTLVPNDTACRDDHLLRVGFMVPADAQRFVEQLTSLGLVFFNGQHFVDLAIVDQHHGPTAPTPWLEIIHTTEGFKFASLLGEDPGDAIVPSNWSPETSITQRGSFVDTADLDTLVDPLDVKGGLQRVYDRRLNKVMYVGRSGMNQQLERQVPSPRKPVPSAVARKALLQYLHEHASMYPSLDHLRLALTRNEVDFRTLPLEVRWGLHYAGAVNML